MMFYFLFIYTLSIIYFSYYFKKKKYFLNYSGDNHQLFSNERNIPLVGGIFLILPLLLLDYVNLTYCLFILLIFLLGIFSDQKILISAKKRFIYQMILVFFSVIFLDLKILSSRLFFFDSFLDIYIFNLFFTTFCLLILINGSNFIDGLNGLLLIYMLSVIFILFKLGFIQEIFNNKNILIYLLFFLIIIIFLNLTNLLMLGDSGAYVLSFFVGYLVIKSHNLNPDISPYFFITLLWYPCFENLFSIIRKIKSNFSPIIPDNSHLHQLIFKIVKKKTNKGKLIANNLSGFIICSVNLFILLLGSKYPQDTVFQIIIIFLSATLYSLTFFILKPKKS